MEARLAKLSNPGLQSNAKELVGANNQVYELKSVYFLPSTPIFVMFFFFRNVVGIHWKRTNLCQKGRALQITVCAKPKTICLPLFNSARVILPPQSIHQHFNIPWDLYEFHIFLKPAKQFWLFNFLGETMCFWNNLRQCHLIKLF